MSDSIIWQRRSFIGLGLGLGLSGLVFATPALAEPQVDAKKRTAESVPVSAPEDLMREHGAVERILLIYEAGARRVGQGEDIDPAVFVQAAEAMRDFVHDYHEKSEEEQIFPRFKKAGRLVELVDVLQVQHAAGRQLTDRILKSANAMHQSKAERQAMIDAMKASITMYRPHLAREDTDLFPTLRSLVTPNEFDTIAETLEKQETAKFGADGFEKTVKLLEQLEKKIGTNDLSQFTPKS